MKSQQSENQRQKTYLKINFYFLSWRLCKFK